MAFQFPWTNLHELNLDWFLSKFKQFTNNYLGTTATAESVPYGTQPTVTVTGGELDDDTDIVDPFTFNFKIPAGQQGEQGEQGEQGVPGQDGFSPIATVTKSGAVATITITDINGTSTTTISDGTVSIDQLNTKAPAIVPTVSGSIVNFSDGADDIAMSELTIGITPIQSGSGNPAPDNIRPISGWTGMTISHSGEDQSTPETISISWQAQAGTVYGGTLNVRTGVLTVTHFFKSFDGTESSWTAAGAGNTVRYYMTWTNMGVVGGVTNFADIICSHLKFLSGNSGTFGTFNATATFFAVKNGDAHFANINDFKSWLATQKTAGTPLQLCAELNTPQTYQLTPQQLFNTLYGVNNVWSDTGDSSVTYTADTKLYIEQLTQPDDYDMTATTTIANGKFFMVGNNLYRATTTIASGSQIIPGTNATALSLADALNLL